MIRFVVTVLVLCFFNVDVVVQAGKCRFQHAQHDAIFMTMCEARCWRHKNQTKKQSCLMSCKHGDLTKPGQCPDKNVSINTTTSPFVSVCLDTCSKDSQCPGLLKCCRHRCGVTCQEPVGLQEAEGIPPLPTNVTINESKRKKSILIHWYPGEYKGVVLYIIEERHYVGRTLDNGRMGPWLTCVRTNKPTIKYPVQPGRWFNFRVAAVNENGTRGFSEPSSSFKTSAGPRRPKKPRNVIVGPLFGVNGTLRAEVKWLAPQSDLPIERYNIFWSRRLRGARDSVLVHQQRVSKDQNKYILQELQPNSIYFLQIQAIVLYGKQRVKGEKSGKLFNTSEYTNSVQ